MKCMFTGHTQTTRAVELAEQFDRHKRIANCLSHDLPKITDAEMAMAVSSRIVNHWNQCARLAELIKQERGW